MNRHFRKLTKLDKQANKAIGVFLTTEQKLAASNESLQNLVDDLEQEMSHITGLWQQAKAKKALNEGIRKRIAEIVESN